MKKSKALLIITLIYVFAFAVGRLCALPVRGDIPKYFVFDSAATVAVFIFSVLFKNSSVYDAYWSFTPMVMSVVLFVNNRAFSAFQLIFLAIFLVWSVRLTANWITVFTGFDYEDWRYRKFRNETPKALWPAVNFFGIHYMPTFLVFLGMLPLFVISKTALGPLSLFGDAVMLFGIALEFFADRQMHAFLSSQHHGDVCSKGLWKYSRHPNYLGEISVWLGVFLVMLPYAPEYLYYIAGAAGIALMFNVISIPLMEKRQLKRRPAYKEYRRTTSRLLLLPNRK